jgi:hypothetical protein
LKWTNLLKNSNGMFFLAFLKNLLHRYAKIVYFAAVLTHSHLYLLTGQNLVK